jgi:hypothetical protein
MAHPLTDDGGLADHHASVLIDEKTAVDLRGGIDVDPGERVRKVGNHARQKRHPQEVKRVRQAVINEIVSMADVASMPDRKLSFYLVISES